MTPARTRPSVRAPTDRLERPIDRRELLRRAGALGVALALTGLPLRSRAQGTAGPAFGPGQWIDPDGVDAVIAPALSGCPTATATAMAQLRLLDARDADAFAAGHLVTALGAPHDGYAETRDGVPGLLLPLDRLQAFLDGLGLDPGQDTVLYSDEGNLWATRLFWVLDYLGHPRLRLLDGGVAAWQARGLPLVDAVPAVPPGRFVAEPVPDRIADTAWVETHLDDPSVVFVDARDEAAYRRGHLPGAVSLPWRENVDWASERLQSAGTLLTRYDRAGVRPEREVVCYCQLGVLSAHHYAILRGFGFPRIRLYDGSWAAWTQDAARPVATS